MNDKPTLETFECNVDYARVHTPTVDKFDKSKEPREQFSLTMVMDEDEKKSFEKLLSSKGVSLHVYRPDTDPPEKLDRVRLNEKTGKFNLQLKRNAINSKGDPTKILVVNAFNQSIDSSILIGNGSRAIVSFYIVTNPNNKKKSLKLHGLQVLELKEPSPENPFKTQDTGFGGTSINEVSGDSDEESPF